CGAIGNELAAALDDQRAFRAPVTKYDSTGLNRDHTFCTAIIRLKGLSGRRNRAYAHKADQYVVLVFGKGHIACLYKCAFDTRHGNTRTVFVESGQQRCTADLYNFL